jgi:RNA polymerase sigma-70 factor (ECF subfamily)
MSAGARSVGAMSSADVECFERERPRLVGLAYRLLGSLADAEDVVQEAWLRWQQTEREAIEQPAAWLTTVTSRIGLDRLRARQRDRADYVGPWLPEPIVVPMDAADPAHHAELSDSLTTAFLVLLEELSPTERLVLLLADVFDQPYAEISAILGRSSDACRQVASRARRKVREAEAPRRGRATGDAAALAAAGAFVDAARRGDQQALLELLAPDAVLVSDGGAGQHAARRPVVGADRVCRFVLNLVRRLPAGLAVEPCWVNGSPGFAVRIAGVPAFVQAFEVDDGRINRISVVSNPDKLHGLDQRVRLA